VSNGTKTIEFEIELTSPVKQHKFNGQEREKELKQKPFEEQAEAHTYRCGNGNIAFPAMWIYGSLLDAYYELAGKSERTKTQKQMGSRIQVSPPMLDTGIEEYEVDVASAPAGSTFRGGTRDMFPKPRIDVARVRGTIRTTVAPKDMREKLEYAGLNVGIGSDRKHGYGRFRVIDWKVVN
jgi:hypothetical protein